MSENKCCRCGKKTALEILVTVGEESRSVQAAFCIDCAPNLKSIRQKFQAGTLAQELETLTGKTTAEDKPKPKTSTKSKAKKKKPATKPQE